ncbi:phosphoribosylglycinamide formyltransferase [Arthrobacter agilis]|uniref:phosphoribosylglycinamide formyltransferase n=1 Tax=Arthrobacter agilis TaxID=37921 RepID=UPI000B353987|nr:phosphoribosylglycinamide formyltransferase [Arthrobacter agilis]OUM40589.1 phosphoribosylglycinamide formyltransferase [Arthrobacter agilis]PPB45201.1 phosphoribosylglycinamide formyltransferase [Arthrobacter agilis]TPV27903.1 phosphoribosylglycinamide formyltransferase [Arthrobacter agilis]WDF34144.1 phosphoribosylglycinamide formyltransferase [Arthrobacter agilis]VDR31418.1 Phosphoribosylglycinamide formyltransferase [Arthrobacter agilis]
MRIVVLVSGTGSNLQAVMDAVEDGSLPVTIAAVGADRPGTGGVRRAAAAGIETFEVDFRAFADRAAWNRALTEAAAAHEPDYVVSSGFMRILDQQFLDRFPDRYLNTHPALLPSFPGAHGVRDALAYGVKVTGCTVMIADAGVDTGPILAQAAVEVRPDDTEDSLHERIKIEERRLLIETLQNLAARLLPASGTADA